jgi:hypothetical protein
MVRTTLALCAVVLSGCSYPLVDGQARPGDSGPEACAVKVFVRPSPSAGKVRILVDNDPVYPRGCGGNTVTWRLLAPNYTFLSAQTVPPGQGIAFDKGGPSPDSCTPGATEYSCTFTSQPAGTRLPYSVNVLGPGGKFTVDPSVIID